MKNWKMHSIFDVVIVIVLCCFMFVRRWDFGIVIRVPHEFFFKAKWSFSNVLWQWQWQFFIILFHDKQNDKKKKRAGEKKITNAEPKSVAVIKQNEKIKTRVKEEEREREREAYEHLTWNDIKLAQEYKLHTWRYTLCYRIVCIQNLEIRMYANQIVNVNGNEQKETTTITTKTKHRKMESMEMKRKSSYVKKGNWVAASIIPIFFFFYLKYVFKWKWWMVSWSVRVMTELHWIVITTCNFGGSYMYTYNILNANLSCGFSICAANMCKLRMHVSLFFRIEFIILA